LLYLGRPQDRSGSPSPFIERLAPREKRSNFVRQTPTKNALPVEALDLNPQSSLTQRYKFHCVTHTIIFQDGKAS
jgi:hypothetical protein